jgi:predicted nucleotidyltransferase
MENNPRIYEALLARCNANRLEALATLDVYMSNPVGIGEHSQIVEEAMKQLEKWAHAEGLMKSLKEMYDSEFDNTNKQ